MTKFKIIAAGLALLASASASAGCTIIDDRGTILCKPEVEVAVEDEAANRVLLPRHEIKTEDFQKMETDKCDY